MKTFKILLVILAIIFIFNYSFKEDKTIWERIIYILLCLIIIFFTLKNSTLKNEK
jgi:protein-S-isoprenylcysteine O-methyltransferase Ste14